MKILKAFALASMLAVTGCKTTEVHTSTPGGTNTLVVVHQFDTEQAAFWAQLAEQISTNPLVQDAISKQINK